MNYDGKQVLKFKTKYKSSDLYNIGKEMTNRVGTGNYDNERSEFNTEYKVMESHNLYQEVKNNLESRNVEYLHKNKTNMLNGVVITSGPEFFMSLGLPFKESDRKYQSGKKKGENILVPDIKSIDDIPYEVNRYFYDSYDWLKEQVGEENIIMAQVHYDEDTPHLQAYFVPVVNEVKRKCYEHDSNGNVVKEISIDMNGNEKLVPKLVRDENNKIVYETVKGNFLNNDQFWKDRGGNASFANLQDSYNKYMTERGFNLDRGEVGANKESTDKLQYKANELKSEVNNLKLDLEKYQKELNDKVSKQNKSLKQSDFFNVIPNKGKLGYSSKDVDKFIDYSKELHSNNINMKKLLRKNIIKLNKLENNLNHDNLIKKVNELNLNNSNLKQSKEFYKKNFIDSEKGFKEVSKALSVVTKVPFVSLNDSYQRAKKINAEYESIMKKLNREGDEAAEEFYKMNQQNDSKENDYTI